MRIDIMTLFPDAIEAMMGQSIIGRARERGYIRLFTHQIRNYTTNKQMQVDDYPYGGGRGAVMQADPLYRCWEHVCGEVGERPHTIYMSPCGRTFTQEVAKELKAAYENILLVCGHYEGVDQRFIDECVDEELSMGDFVLTGGEIPAMAVADCLFRMEEGVLPEESCYTDESHWNGLWSTRSIPAPRSGTGARCRPSCSAATTAAWTTGAERRATSAPWRAGRISGRSSMRAPSPPSTTKRCCSRPRTSLPPSRKEKRNKQREMRRMMRHLPFCGEFVTIFCRSPLKFLPLAAKIPLTF